MLGVPAVDPRWLSLVIVMYGADTHSWGVGLLWCVWDTRAWQGKKICRCWCWTQVARRRARQKLVSRCRAAKADVQLPEQVIASPGKSSAVRRMVALRKPNGCVPAPFWLKPFWAQIEVSRRQLKAQVGSGAVMARLGAFLF